MPTANRTLHLLRAGIFLMLAVCGMEVGLTRRSAHRLHVAVERANALLILRANNLMTDRGQHSLVPLLHLLDMRDFHFSELAKLKQQTAAVFIEYAEQNHLSKELQQRLLGLNDGLHIALGQMRLLQISGCLSEYDNQQKRANLIEWLRLALLEALPAEHAGPLHELFLRRWARLRPDPTEYTYSVPASDQTP